MPRPKSQKFGFNCYTRDHHGVVWGPLGSQRPLDMVHKVNINFSITKNLFAFFTLIFS